MTEEDSDHSEEVHGDQREEGRVGSILMGYINTCGPFEDKYDVLG